jgi:hypothetical protein
MVTSSHTEEGEPAARPSGCTRIEVIWHAVIDYLVPIGYEDETGFHFGEMPA